MLPNSKALFATFNNREWMLHNVYKTNEEIEISQFGYISSKDKSDACDNEGNAKLMLVCDECDEIQNKKNLERSSLRCALVVIINIKFLPKLNNLQNFLNK